MDLWIVGNRFHFILESFHIFIEQCFPITLISIRLQMILITIITILLPMMVLTIRLPSLVRLLCIITSYRLLAYSVRITLFRLISCPRLYSRTHLLLCHFQAFKKMEWTKTFSSSFNQYPYQPSAFTFPPSMTMPTQWTNYGTSLPQIEETPKVKKPSQWLSRQS